MSAVTLAVIAGLFIAACITALCVTISSDIKEFIRDRQRR